MRSSGAECESELAKRIGEKLGEEDWRDTWLRGSAACEEEEMARIRGRKRSRRRKRRSVGQRGSEVGVSRNGV